MHGLCVLLDQNLKLEVFIVTTTSVLSTRSTVARDIPLTDQGQNATAIYETVHATYEEIPANREVKGDYSYTQNNAYLTECGPGETPAAGGKYNNNYKN